MRLTLVAALILSVGCAPPAEREIPAQPPPINPGDESKAPAPVSQDDNKPVALIDGEPVTWRTVVEHAMATRGKELIDKYISWKLRTDKLDALGIRNSPDELRRRAQLWIESTEKEMGPVAFEKMLDQLKTTRDERAKMLSESPEFDDLLRTEKAVVYAFYTEAAIEIDTVAFTDRDEATSFAAEAGRTTFPQAVESLKTGGAMRGKVGFWPRHRFSMGLAPDVIAAAPDLEKKLFALKKGETLGPETAKNNIIVVVNVVEKHPAADRPYAALADKVISDIFRQPPGTDRISLWLDRLAKTRRVQYEDRNSPRNQGR
jgi:hypothetical protein